MGHIQIVPASLYGAMLGGALLGEAMLRGTLLGEAMLGGTLLGGAMLGGTLLGEVVTTTRIDGCHREIITSHLCWRSPSTVTARLWGVPSRGGLCVRETNYVV